MAKAQNQAKAATEVPQDVTETLPEEVEEQISLLPEETADTADSEKPEEVEGVPPEETAEVCTLDRSQPYGEVYGAGGIAFEQGGKYFDRSGNQIPEAEA